MGQTLSSPDTEKHSTVGGDERFFYGICEMQGWRISMEDAHTLKLKLEDDNGRQNAFFAVYDGHGGGSVAKYSGDNVHRRLVSDEAYREEQWESALKKAFLGVDEDIRSDARFFRDPSGCTAVVALVTYDNRVFVANAGDSRAVISVRGEAKPLSFDHKPLNESEMSRIKNAGGYIEYGRVNGKADTLHRGVSEHLTLYEGNLALSRAIGDFEFKKNYALSPEEQIITANPDVTEHKLTEEDEFLVLACDGIWDCLTSQQVVDVVRLQIAERKELNTIAEFLCDHCLAPDTTSGAGVGCDNMTVVIVALLNGRTKDEWYNWVVDRVNKSYGYPTPSEVPQLYSTSRIDAFHARKQAFDQHMRERYGEHELEENNEQVGVGGLFGRPVTTGALGIARAMLGGGISFHPGSGIVQEDGSLMFTSEDSDEEESDDDGEMGAADKQEPHTDYYTALGLNPPPKVDVTKSLKAQLDELEESDGGPNVNPEDRIRMLSGSREAVQQTSGADEHIRPSTNGIRTAVSGEAPPPPPPPQVNGTSKIQPLPQFGSILGGDEAAPAVKAEGLMDASESPF